MTGPAEMSDAAFSERMNVSGDLGAHLCEHLWSEFGTLRLGDQDYEVAGDDVPGYEDDDWAVLLRRKSDGKVFEAEIDVTVRPVREPTQVTP
jgi:uncharacterized protein YbaA (DUF1428 family)